MKQFLLLITFVVIICFISGCSGRSSGSSYLGTSSISSDTIGDSGFLGKSSNEDTNNPNRKIIVFKAGTQDSIKESLASQHGTFVKHLSLLNASVVVLRAPSEKDSLSQSPDVERVDDDIELTAIGKGAAQPSQTTPWGISRIYAPQTWSNSTSANVKIGIIDSGISTSHPDLIVAGGVNTINSQKGYNDDNGHGSHVAGIVAAQNNGIGVIGGGYNASIYAVKVLGANGSGYLSDVIEGIQWCINNGIRLANMSLGTSSNNQSLYDAIKSATQNGLIIVAAAGNTNGGSVLYPAAYPEVIAVSASTKTDGLASFSSVGSEIDVIAPGSEILSTYKGSGYATLNGTSMAAPHVTAACGLKLAISPTVTPDQMRMALQSSADPISGLTSNQQGAGIINAQKLIATQ